MIKEIKKFDLPVDYTTEQLPQISIPGLPKGWKAVAYRLGKEGEMAFINNVWELERNTLCPVIIVEKIQPRRIVMEETGEERSVSYGD